MEMTPIEKAQLRRKEMAEQGIVMNRDPNKRFIEKPRPMRAIRRFCWECNGYSLTEASKCTNKNCALWLFRFGKSNPIEKEIPAWRKEYTQHLKDVGEFEKQSPAAEQDEVFDDDEKLEDGEE